MTNARISGRINSKSLFAGEVDGRSLWARRYRDLVAGYVDDAGGVGAISELRLSRAALRGDLRAAVGDLRAARQELRNGRDQTLLPSSAPPGRNSAPLTHGLAAISFQSIKGRFAYGRKAPRPSSQLLDAEGRHKFAGSRPAN